MTPNAYLQSFRLYLLGQINDDMLQSYDRQFEKFAALAPAERVSVTVVITSNGGNTLIARALHERIRLLSRLTHVATLALGDCSSAALIPYVAVSRRCRFTTDFTHFMFHECRTGPSMVQGGNREQYNQSMAAAQLDQAWMAKDSDWMVGMLAAACKCSKAKMRRYLEPGYHLSGAAAVDFGLAHSVMAV